MREDRFAAAGEFYDWHEDLGGSPRGTVLRHEPLEETFLVQGAARGFRILYVSVGHAGHDIPISGLLYLPSDPAPLGGWPVISYAHGTTGIIPDAAPSLRPTAQVLGHPLLGMVPRFLEAGYAVVCTDYEGLGTAGLHPYLHGPSLSASQIDAVRAARRIAGDCSPTWLAMGHSEGGLATLFTAASASAVAPELDYRGAVATAPPTEWSTLSSQTSDMGRILTPLILHAAGYHDPSVDADDWLNDNGHVLWNAWRTSYLHEPGTVLDTFTGLYGKPLLKLASGEISDAEAAARLSESVDYDGLEVPRERLDRPVFLGEGGADEFCVPGTVERLAADLSATGSDVEYHCYAGTGHLDVPSAAFPDSLPFVRRLTAAVE
ncbi:hypothetical protein FHS43_005378 [Streptosporangium becharense]|uniref:Dienelactone hydrolase n=1 Tax=Streptosporangium becharense TaxID=1816182 RepID=A0A7W9MEC5_9ACTN|nr:lipase family protein [Streptosporangium becharense]MBB2914066.1 hypothetical protein [Streptosporangium becharense]MBB5817093.1 dienelactone hydrolase [Streptosporangium becharense]